MIQFARYLPLISEAGGTPVFVCPPAMAPLIRCMPGIRVLTHHDPTPRYDAWIDQMSLPRLFGATLATLPGATGYLQADPARVAALAGMLPVGRKVGVVFAGNRAHGNDRRRSVPPGPAFPLPSIPAVDLHQPASRRRRGWPWSARPLRTS